MFCLNILEQNTSYKMTADILKNLTVLRMLRRYDVNISDLEECFCNLLTKWAKIMELYLMQMCYMKNKILYKQRFKRFIQPGHQTEMYRM